MPTDLRTAIEDSAEGPQRTVVDGTVVEEHPLKDQIAADRYLDGKTAVDASATRGLRFSRLSPPGGTGL